jgi:hypothetical protein
MITKKEYEQICDSLRVHLTGAFNSKAFINFKMVKEVLKSFVIEDKINSNQERI